MSVFKNFQGLENLEKIQGLSKTFKDRHEPHTVIQSCGSYSACDGI